MPSFSIPSLWSLWSEAHTTYFLDRKNPVPGQGISVSFWKWVRVSAQLMAQIGKGQMKSWKGQGKISFGNGWLQHSAQCTGIKKCVIVSHFGLELLFSLTFLGAISDLSHDSNHCSIKKKKNFLIVLVKSNQLEIEQIHCFLRWLFGVRLRSQFPQRLASLRGTWCLCTMARPWGPPGGRLRLALVLHVPSLQSLPGGPWGKLSLLCLVWLSPHLCSAPGVEDMALRRSDLSLSWEVCFYSVWWQRSRQVRHFGSFAIFTDLGIPPPKKNYSQGSVFKNAGELLKLVNIFACPTFRSDLASACLLGVDNQTSNYLLT